MGSAYIIWDRKSQAAAPGTYPSSADATAAINRAKKKNPEAASKTFDAVAVTV